jgi:hypothetical protein
MIACAEVCIITSKHLLSALLALGVLSFNACTLKTNEPEVKSSLSQLSPMQEGCLSHAGATLESYFQGKISQGEMRSFWDCFSHSLSLFGENTRGSQADHYKPEELGQFLEKYFLKGKKIQPQLLLQAMRMKQAIVGGSDKNFTKAELRKTIALVQVMKVESLRLLPYMPLNTQNLKTRSKEEFDLVMKTTESVFDNLGVSFSKSVGGYSIDDFDQLLKEFELFFTEKGTDNASWVRTARNYVGLVKAVKSILIGPPANLISVSDWSEVFYSMPRYYTLSLRVSRLQSMEGSMLHGDGLELFTTIVENGYALFSRSIGQHPEHVISFAETDKLLEEMVNSGVLKIKAEIAKPVVPIIFNKILRTPLAAASAYSAKGISQTSLDYLWQNFIFWSEGQRFLEGVYKDTLGSHWLSSDGISRYDILTNIPEEAVRWTRHRNSVSMSAVKDLQKSISELRPLYPGNSAVVRMPGEKVKPIYSFHDLSTINWTKLIAKVVIRAYAKEPERAQSFKGITSKEAEEFYAEFFPLGVEFKVLSPTAQAAAIQRFLEADLFSYSSNGDNLLNVHEVVEMLAILFSTFEKSDKIHEQIVNRCPHVGVDFKKAITLDANCYRKEIAINSAKYFEHIPAFAKFLDRCDDDGRNCCGLSGTLNSNDAFSSAGSCSEKRKNELLTHRKVKTIMALETIVRKEIAKNAPYEYTHAQGLMLMTYYVEALFERFDVNRSGTIDKDEARMAYPVFEGFLTKAAAKHGLTDPEDVEALFFYIMKYGSVPESLWDKIVYKARTIFRSWTFETNRGQIVDIFAALLKQL